MTLHPDTAALMERYRQAGARPMPELGVTGVRQAIYEARHLQGEREPVASVREVLAAGAAGLLPVRLYDPAPGAGAPLVVYLHGGGWVAGSVAGSDRWCRSLARASGCLVASVEYRRAPETRYPGPLDDAVAATTWLADRRDQLGAAPDRLVVAGDSAGGGLAAGVALRLRDAGDDRLSAQALLYPALDAAAGGDPDAGSADGLTRGEMSWFWSAYLDDPRHADGYASPARAADVSGLPRTLVAVAGHDVLRDEGLAYAGRLAAAGVEVEVVDAAGMVHGFFGQLGAVPAARNWLSPVAEFLRA